MKRRQNWWDRWREARKRERYAARRRADYERHLRSDAWQQIRIRALQRASYRCEWELERGPHQGTRCACTKGLEVHHLHYQTFGREQLSDVLVLCPTHHRIADARRVKNTDKRRSA